LYNLALIFGESSSQREREDGNRLLETLIRVYPESEYRLNALRRIGEFYFNPPVNNLEKAEEVYKIVVSEFKGTPAATEALYKLGWTYYRLNRLDDAVEHFAEALDAQGYDERVPPKEGTTLDIVNESINYICVCYALDPKEWSGAGFSNLLNWLEKNSERRERYGKRLIFQLGDLYYRGTGRYADAVEVYTELLSRYPLSEDIWKAQHNIVEIFQQGLLYDPPRAYQEKDKFFTLFNPQSEWWKVHSGGSAQRDVLPLLERYLNLLIDETLALLVQDKDGQLWEKFEGYSRTYLSFWPNGPNAYKVHYDLASALEKRPGREMDALKEFWAIATNTQDTSHREISTHRILAITQNLMKKEREGEITVLPNGQIVPKKSTNPSNSPNPGNSPNNSPGDDPPDTVENSGESAILQPTELLVSEALLLSGSDLFLSFYAQSSYSPTILYQCGDILFKHNLYKEARGYLERLIKEFPDHQLVSDAYGLVLESHFKEGNVPGVEEVVARIEKTNVKAELKELAKRRKAEAVFLKAAKLKDQDDHLTAAQEFYRVAAENPDYPYADRSLFQAGLEWNQAQQWSKASEAFILLSERYPHSQFAEKAINNAAYNFQTQLGDLSRAAGLYEKLGKTYPRSDLTTGALSNASFAYNQIGDHQGAIRVNELYVSL
ncbi:MAG: tetratricopeptide repeat protein, partial [bacterium]